MDPILLHAELHYGSRGWAVMDGVRSFVPSHSQPAVTWPSQHSSGELLSGPCVEATISEQICIHTFSSASSKNPI